MKAEKRYTLTLGDLKQALQREFPDLCLSDDWELHVVGSTILHSKRDIDHPFLTITMAHEDEEPDKVKK